MCIIIYSPDGNIPKKHLHQSLWMNDDGWGIMFPENGNLQVVYGLKKAEFFREWKWIKKLNAPVVFHARIATHGNSKIDNCHPFMIPGHGQLAVAHNGIISRQAPSLNDTTERSDTRNFVDNILANLPLHFETMEVYRELLSEYVGHSKLVFMDGEGEVTIVNQKHGFWVNKMWYSNRSYLPYRNEPALNKSGSYSYIPYQQAAALPRLGFMPKQQNFPVFSEDETIASAMAASQPYSDCSDDRPIQTSSPCGIGIPSCIAERVESKKDLDLLSEKEWRDRVGADRSVTVNGTMTVSDLEQLKYHRKLNAMRLRRNIAERFPDTTPSAAWASKMERGGEYPCSLPDPLNKYNTDFDMMQ